MMVPTALAALEDPARFAKSPYVAVLPQATWRHAFTTRRANGVRWSVAITTSEKSCCPTRSKFCESFRQLGLPYRTIDRLRDTSVGDGYRRRLGAKTEADRLQNAIHSEDKKPPEFR